MPTSAQAFRLEFTSDWNKLGETDQVWSVKFHTSGDGMSSQAEADTHALALATLVLGAIGSDSYFSRYIHYPVNSNVNDYLNDYGSGAHPGTLDAYSAGPPAFQQLEVCHLWRCAAGKNVKGREKYLFKYIHAAGASGVAFPACNVPAAYVADYLAPLHTGVGPNDLVATLPDGTIPTAEWELVDRLYTRQLRRGTPVPK